MLARWLSQAATYASPPPVLLSRRVTSLAQHSQAFRATPPNPIFNPTSKTQTRAFRTSRGFGENRQYQRFDRSRGNRQLPFVTFLNSWRARRTFKYEVGGLAGAAGGVYVYNLEEVPVSGRRRFNVVGDSTMQEMGKQAYGQIIQQYGNAILPSLDPRVLQVKRVLDRLVPSSGLDPADWEVNVIDSDETNAFVIPGGKVFVFTGILPVCENDDGLAAVLGHEIAHNVAKHSAEKVSQSYILALGFMVLQYFFDLPDTASNMLLTLAFERPGSRKQESEADYIGLLMMAQSCYDPSAAVSFWHRMREVEKTHQAPPELMSTHPSSAHREENLQKWLPKAMDRYQMSECGGVSGLALEFKSRVKAPFI